MKYRIGGKLYSAQEALDIYTALRGPDNTGKGSCLIKCMTTGVVRHEAGFREGPYISSNPDEILDWWKESPAAIRQSASALWSSETHFRLHALRALETLGLAEYAAWLTSLLGARLKRSQ